MKISIIASLFLCSAFLLSCKKSEDSPVAPAASVPPGMILVTGGTFSMGIVVDADEQPVHAVTISSFYLDAKEVHGTGQHPFDAVCAFMGMVG
jgi:formylglycine-generating enzyme required for sulfatase activity